MPHFVLNHTLISYIYEAQIYRNCANEFDRGHGPLRLVVFKTVLMYINMYAAL